jgi:hypothetical protein
MGVVGFVREKKSKVTKRCLTRQPDVSRQIETISKVLLSLCHELGYFPDGIGKLHKMVTGYDHGDEGGDAEQGFKPARRPDCEDARHEKNVDTIPAVPMKHSCGAVIYDYWDAGREHDGGSVHILCPYCFDEIWVYSSGCGDEPVWGPYRREKNEGFPHPTFREVCFWHLDPKEAW